MNFGLRYDYVKQHVVGQKAQVGRFAASPAYNDITLPVWNDISPRTSAVYDVFGNGKTAIRAGFNRFMTAATTGFAQLYNPTAADHADPDVDRLQQRRHRPGRARLRLPDRRTARSTSPTCRRTSASARWRGSTRTSRVRISWRTTSACRTKSARALAVTAEWFHSYFKNLIARNNVALSASDYTPVTRLQPGDQGHRDRLQPGGIEGERGRLRRQQRPGPEARLQRLRDQLQRAAAERRAPVRRHRRPRRRSRTAAAPPATTRTCWPSAIRASTTSRSRPRSSWPAPIRCRSTASPSAVRCRRWPARCSALTRCPTACSRPAPAGMRPVRPPARTAAARICWSRRPPTGRPRPARIRPSARLASASSRA